MGGTKIFPFFQPQGPQSMAMYSRTQVITWVASTDSEDAFIVQLSDEVVTPLEQEPPPEGEPEPEPIYMDNYTAQMKLCWEMALALFNNPDKTKVYFAKSPALEARWATLSLPYLKTNTFSFYWTTYKDWEYSEMLRMAGSEEA